MYINIIAHKQAHAHTHTRTQTLSNNNNEELPILQLLCLAKRRQSHNGK